jgi:hypothetical protein
VLDASGFGIQVDQDDYVMVLVQGKSTTWMITTLDEEIEESIGFWPSSMKADKIKRKKEKDKYRRLIFRTSDVFYCISKSER